MITRLGRRVKPIIKNTLTPTCPYCGDIKSYRDWHVPAVNNESGIFDCSKCGKMYKVTSNVTWSTSKTKQETH